MQWKSIESILKKNHLVWKESQDHTGIWRLWMLLGLPNPHHSASPLSLRCHSAFLLGFWQCSTSDITLTSDVSPPLPLSWKLEVFLLCLRHHFSCFTRCVIPPSCYAVTSFPPHASWKDLLHLLPSRSPPLHSPVVLCRELHSTLWPCHQCQITCPNCWIHKELISVMPPLSYAE